MFYSQLLAIIFFTMICMLYKYLKRDKSDPFYIQLVHSKSDFLEISSFYLFAFHNIILNIALTCTYVYRIDTYLDMQDWWKCDPKIWNTDKLQEVLESEKALGKLRDYFASVQIPIEVISMILWIFIVSKGTRDKDLLTRRNFILLGIMYFVELIAHLIGIYMCLKIPLIFVRNVTHLWKYLTLMMIFAHIINQSIPYIFFVYRLRL